MNTGILAFRGGPPVRPEGPPEWPRAEPLIRDALEQAFADGSWGRYHGPHTEQLVHILRELHGTEVVLCSSGTAAVELALRGLGVGPGDEVLLSAYDFKANFTNILTVGATPVLVDVEPGTWTLDVSQLAAALSPKTKAILASHLHGGIVDMPQVVAFAETHGLGVIEDACQMPAAAVHGKTAGTWGDVGILSFGGSKLTTAGRGGAVLSPGPDILQRIRLYTQRGNEAYPLSELQAAVLVPQWKELLLPQNATRLRAVDFLRQQLSEVRGLMMLPEQSDASACRPGYYKLGLMYEPAAFQGVSRDDFASAMRAEGIAIDAGFRALHRIHAARRFRAGSDLEHATHADSHVLTLHHPVLLESDAALRQILQAATRIQTDC